MYKITNCSDLVIGIMLPEAGRLKQTNLFPGKYILVEVVTEQMFNLLDPNRGQLKLEKVGGVIECQKDI